MRRLYITLGAALVLAASATGATLALASQRSPSPAVAHGRAATVTPTAPRTPAPATPAPATAPPSTPDPRTPAPAPRTPAPAPKTPPVPAPTPAPAPPMSTRTGTIAVGGMVRQYLEYTPGQPLTGSTPIVVFLQGADSTVQEEVERDDLLPLVAEGRLQLVYPVAYEEFWNAGGCCGAAATANIDDVGFIEQLVQQLDPGHARPIDLVGYSNGGRLAYTLACDDPGLFDAYAVVSAVPLQTCGTPAPITVLQVAGTADDEVPYQPGDPVIYPVTVAATQQVAHLQSVDGCTSPAVTTTRGSLILETWSCAGGARVGFATYVGGTHHWSAGGGTTPGAGAVIWSFLQGSAVAP